MKKISSFSHKINAEIAAQALKAQGIEAQIQGAREYSSHILGGDLGKFDLLVDAEKTVQAEDILRHMQLEIVNTSESISTADHRVFFRKAVMFSLLAMIMLPIILNYSALLNLKLYLKSSDKITAKIIIGTLVILTLQVPVFFYIFWALQKFNFL